MQKTDILHVRNMTVTIADDEKNIRLAVKTALEKEGLSVLEFSDGKSVLE